MIRNLYSREEAQTILAIHIPGEDIEDDIEWSNTKSGHYTAKLGYWFLNPKSERFEEERKFWKFIWNTDIFPKWKDFICKIMFKSLPTVENLIKRRIQDIDPLCKLCGKDSESLFHLFRDCEISKRICISNMGNKHNQFGHTPIQA